MYGVALRIKKMTIHLIKRGQKRVHGGNLQRRGYHRPCFSKTDLLRTQHIFNLKESAGSLASVSWSFLVINAGTGMLMRRGEGRISVEQVINSKWMPSR